MVNGKGINTKVERGEHYTIDRIITIWWDKLRKKTYTYVLLTTGDYTVTTKIGSRNRINNDDCWGLYPKAKKHDLDQRWVDFKLRDTEIMARKGML